MKTRVFLPLLVALALPGAPGLGADPQPDIRELKLRDWEPRSMMVTKTTPVEKPMFPVIDMHNHLGAGKALLTPERVRRHLAEMNAAGVRTVVNLDGNLPPEELEKVYHKNAERILFGLASADAAPAPVSAPPAAPELHVQPTDDFEVTGTGSAAAWQKANWEPLHRRTKDGQPHETRVKVLYSKTGLYVLVDAADRKITATIR